MKRWTRQEKGREYEGDEVVRQGKKRGEQMKGMKKRMDWQRKKSK